MIYRAIVEYKLRSSFAAINRGDYAPAIAAFAPNAEHIFFGDHALGGARRSPQGVARWYRRLQALLPDLRFDIQSIAVSGPPWNTRAFVEWRDSFTLRSGEPAGNQGVHAFTLKWGKVTSLRIYCDTDVLQRALQTQAQHGVTEASAAPIGARA